MISMAFTLLQSNMFLRLLLAHLLGDFLFQSDRVCVGKRSNVWCSQLRAHLCHGGVQSLLCFVALGDVHYWYVALLVGLLHLGVDWMKIWMERKSRCNAVLFYADQFLHVAVLLLVVGLLSYMDGLACLWYGFLVPSNSLIVLVAYLLLLKPASIVVGSVLSRFKLQQANGCDENLKQAGQWIGYCERLMALSFIMIGCFEALGFLVAAKSIFRFGDLRSGTETMKTEYVLLGTFLSMTFSVIVGLLCRWVLGM